MTHFELIKASISPREAAEYYGMKLNRNDMALCPFHNDTVPSLHLYSDHFHCFGCGAHGDVIDLTAKLFGLSLKDSADKIMRDFFLDPDRPPDAAMLKPKTEAQLFRENERLCFLILRDYLQLLHTWQFLHAPKSPDEEPDDKYAESCRMAAHVENLMDSLNEAGEQERRAIVSGLMENDSIFKLEQRIKRIRKEEDRDRLDNISAA